MSIPKAVHSEVPKWFFWVGSQIPKVAHEHGGFTVLESAFHKAIVSTSKNNPKIVQSVHEFAVAYIHEIQIVFNLINLSSLVFYGKTLIDEINKKYSFKVLNKVIEYTHAYFVSVLLVGTIFGSVCYILSKKQKVTPPRLQVVQEGAGTAHIEITNKQSGEQMFAQPIHLTKLILSTSLVFFGQNRLGYAVNTLGTLYSHHINSNLRWLNYSRKFPSEPIQFDGPNPGLYTRYGNPAFRISQTKITYNLLSLPYKGADNEDCAICTDSKPDMKLHGFHAYHEDCLGDWIANNTQHFNDGSLISRTALHHERNHVYTHTTYSFGADLSEKNLPTCPECRDMPNQNRLNVEVTDHDIGTRSASVNIVRPYKSQQKLFEKFYAAYNFAQAGFAYLQKYPELATTIVTIQRIALCIDAIGLVISTYYLYNNLFPGIPRDLREGETIEQRRRLEKSQNQKFIAFVAAAITLPLISYFGVKLINRLMRPNIVIKDLLATMNLSPEFKAEATLDWKAPWKHEATQAIHLCRLVTTAALTYFSPLSKSNLISLAAQTYTLHGISSLRWITLNQFIANPVQRAVSQGAWLTTNQISNMNLKAHFLTYPSCSSDSVHLQSTIEAIQDYTNRLFEGSVWSSFWRIIRQNGVEVSRFLVYKIELKAKEIMDCACTLKPSLSEISGSLTDNFYGSALVEFVR